MLGFVVRWYIALKEKFIGPATSKVAPYPFDKTMGEYLPHPFSPVYAVQFLRTFAEAFHISLTEAEILFLLVSEENPIPLTDILAEIDHISEDRVKRLLRELLQKRHIFSYQLPHEEVAYGLMPYVRDDIRSYHKD